MKIRNLVLFLADQWRGDTLAAAGHPGIETPNLDALIAEGVTFRQHYTTASPCGPARTSLLTGLYMASHRMVQNGTPLDDRHDNLARAMRRSGREAAMFGYTSSVPDPRGLGPNNAAGQLFTFDVPQGGPTEHLRLLLVPADADLAAGHLPPPAEGRAYYLYTLDGAARAQIQAAQATANARAVPGKSVQIGVVPHLCSAGPVDQYATTVSIFATLPGRTGPLPFMNHETLANVLQMPGSTQLAICNG